MLAAHRCGFLALTRAKQLARYGRTLCSRQDSVTTLARFRSPGRDPASRRVSPECSPRIAAAFSP